MEKNVSLDLQILFNLAIGAAIAAFGWFFRQTWDNQKLLAEDLKKIEVNLPLNYVRRDEFGDAIKEVKEMFTYIRNKLDEKADK